MAEEKQEQNAVETPEQEAEQVQDVEAQEQNSTESDEPTREELEKALKASSELIAEYKDRLLRSQADFENYKKRTQREKLDTAQYAKEEVVKKLLPVLDNFDLALDHASTENVEAYRKGVELVAKQLRDVLESEGLSEIETDNVPFDPNYHHGVAVDNNPDVEDQHITETLQKGYQLGERVLRPAMVKVNQK